MEHEHILRLVEQAQSSGLERERACNELYKRYYPQTRAYCASLMKKNWNDLEVLDFTAEVIAKAFCKLHLYSGQWYLTIWIKSICTHQNIDRIRRLQTQKYTLVDLDKARNIQSGMNSDVRIICSDHMNTLNNHIDCSPELHSKVMRLFFQEQKSYREISILTGGTPLPTISSILSRGRKKLSGKMER